jgi:Domain of unknown function (DUF4382)
MVPKRRLSYLASAAVVGCMAGAIGCGGSPSGPSGSGSLRVMLKDSPFHDASAVLVTFSEVSVHQDTDADFTPLKFAADATSRTCDLLRLQKDNAQDVLGIGTLDAGHYTQVRLLVSDAKLYLGDQPSTGDACGPGDIAHVTGLVPPPTPPDTVVPLTIPSGEVKLNREFDVPEGGTTLMSLDFDGDHSIIQTGNGNYMMKPVIAVVSVSSH